MRTGRERSSIGARMVRRTLFRRALFSRRWGLFTALLLLAGLLAASPAHAQGQGLGGNRWEFEGFEMSVRELFTARAASPWSSIEFVLTNTGTERREPTVRVVTTMPGEQLPRVTTFSTVISPGAVRRRLVPICNLTDEGWAGSIALRFEVFEGGGAIDPLDESQSLQTNFSREQHWRWGSGGGSGWFPWQSLDVLVVSGESEPDGWRDALEDDVRLATNAQNTSFSVDFRTLQVEALPVDVEAYSGLDRLVLIETPPDRLSERQRAALHEAVRLGLTVWIIPGAGGEGNEWVWPERLRTIASVNVTLENGETRPFFVVDTELEPGTVRTDEEMPGVSGPVPITVRYREGAGEWLRVTSPVGPWEGTFLEAPRENWPDQVARFLIDDPAGRGNRGFRNTTSSWVQAIDQVFRRSINAEVLFIFVVIYLLIAGPGLFLFLKRKGRLPWLLWLQPAVVAVFLIGTGLLGWVHFGVGSRTDDTVILYMVEGESGGVLVRLRSVYSAVSSRRAIGMEGESLPIPVPAAVRKQPLEWSLDGEVSQLDGFRTRTWSLSHFLSMTGVDVGTIELSTNSSREPIIDNRTSFPLTRITCRSGSSYHRDEHIDPGDVGRPEALSGRSPEAPIMAVPGSPAPPVDPEWSELRRVLWRWLDDRTTLSVRAVGEFDPARLPAEVRPAELSEGARGFVVVLGDGSGR